MKKIVLLLAAALTLAACANRSDKGAQQEAAVPQVTTTASAAPAAKSQVPALGAVQTFDTSAMDFKAVAYRYRQPLPSAFPPDRRGYTYAGVDARVCITSLKDADVVPLSWMPWSLEFADDTTTEPTSGWSDDWFRVPLYPADEKLVRPGGCVRGWVLFEVPKNQRPVRVVYSPDSGTEEGIAPATWAIG